VLRIGGTAADYMWYLPDDPRLGDACRAANDHSNCTIISDRTWAGILDFAADTGVTLLWDLDALQYRDVAGNWDPSQNATAFLAKTQAIAPAGLEIWWSIGNEPDLWAQKPSAAQLAKDALILKAELGKHNVGTVVYGPSFAGISTTDGATYIQSTVGSVQGATFHNYPLRRDCTVTDYLDRTHVDTMAAPMLELAASRAAANANDLLLVLEETGGSYGGGCPNITNRFISGFWYLHALGVTAESGFDRVHRQDVVGWSFTGCGANPGTCGSSYSLAGPAGWVNDTAALTPHPDYFTSILFKMLVAGTNTFKLSVTGSDPTTVAAVSLHLFCGSADAGGKGSLTLVYVNPTANSLTIDLGTTPVLPRMEYVLTSSKVGWEGGYNGVAAPPASLTNDNIFLNGVHMHVNHDGALPAWPLPGKTGQGPLTVPAYSYGFVAIAAGLSTC
jgi:hypothetical protein